ncbi:MAG: hypothetical protein IKJ31_05825 [Bacteroidaceae bacterium]|nr:hypothetical protein [Bacteroidaceae bacterium]
MQKSFSFRGIVRNTDNLFAREGECMELVNMRVCNGSLEPIAPPFEIARLPAGYSAIYYHTSASVYMCITSKDKVVHLYDITFSPLSTAVYVNSAPLLSNEAVDVQRIEFSGNIACLLTSSNTLYAIYDNGKYKWLGASPKLPKLTFTIDSVIHKVTTEDEYYQGVIRDSEKASLYWNNASKGYFDECVAKLNEQGYFVDRALFRFAFRLFDGSYAYYSPIYYVDDKNSINGLYRDKGNFVSARVNTTDTVGLSKYNAMVQGFKPTFHFSGLNLSDWENIIVSVDMFTSGSIMGHKIVNNGKSVSSRIENVNESPSDGYDSYVNKTNAEIFNDISTTASFYKIAEYKLNGVLQNKEENVSYEKLVLCNSLPADNGTLSNCSANYSYMFNGRLHLASLREKLFGGYDGDCFLPVSLSSVYVTATVYTELKTSNGTSVVRKQHNGNFPVGVKDNEYLLSPYISYPDSRAVKMTLSLLINDVFYTKSFSLIQHKTLNLAYYLNTKDSGLTLNVDATNSSVTSVRVYYEDMIKSFFSYKIGSYSIVYTVAGGWMFGDKVFDLHTKDGSGERYPAITWRGTPVDGDTIIFTIANSSDIENVGVVEDIVVDSTWENSSTMVEIPEVNTIEIRKNVLKVSAVDNPFLFPAIQTYAPTDEEIIGVCSNTVALSQGQFGQHPLYIFCSNGIWAMSVDASGTFAYTGSYPMSREVCTNANSIRGIDAGVVFITAKGVMLLYGGNIKHLSSSMDADTHPLKVVSTTNIFSRIAAIVSLNNIFQNETFHDYLLYANIGFNYSKREIVVSNPAYPYSYLYSLENGEWSKISYSFNYVLNSYPQLLCVKSEYNKTILLTPNNYVVSENSVLLISRPLLWGGKLFKRVLQMLLHATVKPATAENAFNGLACYLLCSNDGVNFKLVTGSERRVEFFDMTLPYIPTQSYRYFAIALVGNISTNSKINAVEMYIDAAWNNRLR